MSSNALRASSGRWKALFSLLVTNTSLAGDAGLGDRLADLLLVAVHLGGVDVPIAGFEGGQVASTVSAGSIWKTPNPNCGIVWPLFSMISGICT